MHFSSFIGALVIGLLTTRQGYSVHIYVVNSSWPINLLFSVMGYLYSCTCPSKYTKGFSLADPTLACCSQQSQSGTFYTPIVVRSDCHHQIEWLLTRLKWIVPKCATAWYPTVQGLLPRSKLLFCGGRLCLGNLTTARRHTLFTNKLAALPRVRLCALYIYITIYGWNGKPFSDYYG